MPTIEEKLAKFDQTIQEDAIRARDAILERLRQESKQKTEDIKAEIEREAVQDYAKATLIAEMARDSAISRASVNLRKQLMGTRDGIMASVLDDLTSRLDVFTGTEQYREFLFKGVSDALELAGWRGGSSAPAGVRGASGYALYLTPRDGRRYKDEIQKSAPGVEIRDGDADMIGGVLAENTGEGKIVDNTLKTIVGYCAEEFFRISNLTLD